jgi:hypothetical protein
MKAARLPAATGAAMTAVTAGLIGVMSGHSATLLPQAGR